MELGLLGIILSKTVDKLLVWAPKLVEFIIIILLFFILAKILKKIIKRISKRFDISENIQSLIIRSSNITIIIVGLITAFGTLKVNVSALVAGLGLTGFALGFAFKDTIANLISGALILIYHPFQLGDIIMVSGFEGKVSSIDLRYTRIIGENEEILIPNSKLFVEVIKITSTK